MSEINYKVMPEVKKNHLSSASKFINCILSPPIKALPIGEVIK